MRSALLIAGAITCLLTGCGSMQEAVAPSLLSYGLGIELPAHWQGYVGRGLLVATSFALDDPGLGWLDAGPPGPDDVQIVVLERDGGPPHAPLVDYEPLSLPVTVRGEDFDNESTLTAAETANQSVGHRAVEIHGRKFEVFVTLGVPQPDATLVSAANAVLATLRVDDVPPPTGSVSPPTFPALDGWQVVDSGPQRIRVEGNDGFAIASTSPIHDASEAIPDRSVAALAPGGALIQVRVQQSALLPFTRSPQARLPKVRDFPPYPPGEERPGVIHLRDGANLDNRSYNTTIDVYIRSPSLSPNVVARTQAMLDRLVLPDWGPWDQNAQRIPARLSFTPADGWTDVQHTDKRDSRVQFAWTTNVPLAGNDVRTKEPRDTAMTLPTNGIVITATRRTAVDDADAASFVPMSEPLTLASGRFSTGQYENQPAPNVSKYAVDAKIRDSYINVEVLLGSPDPNPQLTKTAEQALQRLVVP